MDIERSNEHILLNHEQLLLMVRKVFPNCLKIDKWKILLGGAVNTTYQIIIGSEKFVLRLYARNRSYCKTERIIHQFINNKVLTPKLIYADESYIPWAYSIFEFIDGNHISNLAKEQKESLSYELGRTLASIHSFKLPQAGLFSDGMSIEKSFAKGSSPYFEETMSIITKGKFIRDRLGDNLYEKMLNFTQENYNFFPKIENNICLTHSDFKPVNLLYKAKNVFVLDWEFAHAGIGILDFAILLRHRNQFPCDCTVLAQGYLDCGGILPKDWFRSALITDFVNIAHLLESPAERPELFDQLRSTVFDTMNRWKIF